MKRNDKRRKPFVAPQPTSELVLHIVTRPYGSQFHVCRIMPGRPPVSVGAFDSHEEAVAVRAKLDMMADNDLTDEPIPQELDELLCQI